ncbi:hypothetical protein ACFQ2M_29000 [Kitasatospora saccharophila]|uniref:hypothetical protein n=1 Tax=Kitasatospora saccharophila TaxID=407973 RepID=UPI00363157A2
MTDQRRIARRTRNAAAAALVTVLAVSTAACSKSADPSPAASSAQPSSTSSKPSVDIADVQKFLAEVPNWGADDWKKWASQNGFKPEDFATIKHFWDQEKPVAPRGGTSVTPEKQAPSLQKVVLPPSVPAKAVPHPYSPDTALLGRIILKNAEGEDHSCSGTVVTDPQHPGKSNLVGRPRTACTAARAATTTSSSMFLPGYNRSGASSHGKQPEDWQDIAPLGRWVAQNMVVPPQWTREGLHVGNQASQFDFAIVRVAPLDDTRSLEEAVGGSVPIAFNLKQADIAAPKAYGYPADSPFDGEELEHCDSNTALVPFTYNPSRPPMLIMGCTMTGGSSGGGWLTKQGGKAVLFSNVSIGDPVSGWQAGPTLGPEAKNLFDAFVSG